MTSSSGELVLVVGVGDSCDPLAAGQLEAQRPFHADQLGQPLPQLASSDVSSTNIVADRVPGSGISGL